MEAWLAQYFLNPAFVVPFGAALVAAPLIIHLLNRMRYRRVRFAAMDFLLASQEQNRRRLLLEELLLLLLRVLIVAALIALLARLVLDPARLSVFRGAQVHHVVLLDDSGSMRNNWGQTSAFQEATDVVLKLVAECAQHPETQKFSMFLLSDPERPLFIQRDVNEAFLDELAGKLESLECSHRSTDLVAGLESARDFLAEERATIEHLHFVSDYRLADWERSGALSATIGALDEEGVAVNLVRTVPQQDENLAVTGLDADVQSTAVGVPTRLSATVRNFGEQLAQDVRMTIVQDGQRLPVTVRFEKIEAGTESTREFDVTFPNAGRHWVRVGLDADPLTEDNSHFTVVNVVERLPVLIVDGNPAGDEGLYLADAIGAEPGVTGIDPLIEGPDFLRRQSLEEFQAVYLLNVPELMPDALDRLDEYVRNGGGLAWFVGPAVKPGFYNSRLHSPGEESLFPVPLASARRELTPDDQTTPGPDLNFAAHPLFRIFSGQDNPFVESVTIDAYLPVGEQWVRDDNQRRDGVSTIATLRNRDPLIFEHRYGEGRVLTCLSSAGPQWNSWARNPSYVVFQLEMAKHLSNSNPSRDQRIVGEPIEFSLDPAIYTEDVELLVPDATGQPRRIPLKASPAVGEAEATSDAASETMDGTTAALESDSSRESDSPDNGAEEAAARGQSIPSVDSPQASPEQAERSPAGSEEASSEGAWRLSVHYPDTDQPGVYRIKLTDHNRLTDERWLSYNFPVAESDLELATETQLRERIGEDVRVQIQPPGRLDWMEASQTGQEARLPLLLLLVGLMLAEQWLAYRLSYHPKSAGAAA